MLRASRPIQRLTDTTLERCFARRAAGSSNKPNPPPPKTSLFPSPPFSSPPASLCANPLAPHRSCPQKSTTLHSRHAAKLPRQRTFSDRLGGLSPQASGHHGLQNRAKTDPDPRTPMLPKILAFRTGAPRSRPVVARFPVYKSGFRRLPRPLRAPSAGAT